MKFIYLFINIPFVWFVKIGISRNAWQRSRQVSKKVPGLALPIWAVPMPNAEGLERQLHGFFKRFNLKAKGFGREWFFLPVLPVAWLIINFMFLLYWSPVWGIAIWVYLNQ